MPDTFTTNLNLTKPEVGASADTWGTKLNANNDAIDALFPSGDLAVANGGTGASDAVTARANLGLGTMATQSADDVAITGGLVTDISALSIAAPSPYIILYETDAAENNKQWVTVVSGQQFAIAATNDTWSVQNNAITITRSGLSPSAVNIGAPLTVSGNVAYHAGNISAATIAESQITDGAVLARVAGNETVSGTWNFTTRPTISGNGVLDSASSLAWANLTGVPSSFTPSTHNHVLSNITTGAGGIVYFASASNTGGAVTVSTSDPSGTPAAGDIWLKYTA